ncbi:hypothetical protein J1N35_005648 [Gossypium stocksii]|uniref:Uncharacterized protein n=1 Tax=Gossypium stocksii TaxID=47602 RepID=A0A9D3WEW9_9ROSI|nr:hypothetical protein J1N35_005648 [Gossypium stocksii]
MFEDTMSMEKASIDGSSSANNLLQLHQLLTSCSKENIDALSFELPKLASKFAGVLPQCLAIYDKIIHRFIEKCSSDMPLILCEVLVSVSHNYLHFALRLASILPYSGISGLGLITGYSADTMSHIVIREDEEDFSSFSSHVYLGASFWVIFQILTDLLQLSGCNSSCLARGEMHKERILRTLLQKNEALEADSKTCQSTLFWSTSILELVEFYLPLTLQICIDDRSSKKSISYWFIEVKNLRLLFWLAVHFLSSY